MFKLLLLLLTSITFLSATVAQVDLALNLLGISDGYPDIAIEYGLSDRIGVEVLAGIPVGKARRTGLFSHNTGDWTYRKSGVLATLQGKYYFKSSADHSGFYGSIYLRTRNVRFGQETRDGSSTAEQATYRYRRISTGLAFGGKLRLASRFLIEGTVGGGFTPLHEDTLQDKFPSFVSFRHLDKYDLYARLSIGYRIVR